jgi:nucleoside-diphosphate kinase
MKEKTLVLIKPDAVQRGLVGEILIRFERCGLKIIGMKMCVVDEFTAGQHYMADENWLKSVGEKKKKSIERQGRTTTKTELELGNLVRNQLMAFLQKSPVFAIVLQGHNAIAHVRKLVGETSPQFSPAGTIRGDFSFDTFELSDIQNRPLHNLIHASTSIDEANREIAVWFKPQEVHEWSRIDDAVLYDSSSLNQHK